MEVREAVNDVECVAESENDCVTLAEVLSEMDEVIVLDREKLSDEVDEISAVSDCVSEALNDPDKDADSVSDCDMVPDAV